MLCSTNVSDRVPVDQMVELLQACFRQTKRGLPNGQAPFTQQAIFDYFLVVDFFAGAFLLSGGANSVLVELI